MYVTIRKYAGCGDLKEVNRVALAELLPVLRTIPGFRSYVIVDTGNGTGASIGMFDNKAAAETPTSRPARSCSGLPSRFCCPTRRKSPWERCWGKQNSPRGHRRAGGVRSWIAPSTSWNLTT